MVNENIPLIYILHSILNDQIYKTKLTKKSPNENKLIFIK